ncbi:MAG TPA: MnhB domain-containing protein [Pirellulales bacterium]|jgi:multicomponent Na+:H+ antiporter subunit B|nr:MnhB domain-containing protein [Pirellulales bacterium]
MSDRTRKLLFFASAAGFGAFLLWALAGLPRFGDYRGAYGRAINSLGVPARHVTDMATAINFDFRGFDTLGEEYILFVSVTGLALLLRRMRGEIEDAPLEFAPDRQVKPRGDCVGGLGLLLTGATNLFGLYIVVHAHLTPGGGFQGGAILGTACLLVYLAIGYRVFRTISPKSLMESAESIGAGGYAAIGIATLIASGAFLANCLPLGKTGNLFSGGTIPVINLAVGLEVAGGFILMFAEFLKTTRRPAESRKP